MDDVFNDAAAPPPASGELVEVLARINRMPHAELEANHAALEKSCLEAVEDFLARGAVVDDKNSGGYTPLIYAAVFGFAEVTRLLISKGAAVNERSGFGEGFRAISFAANRRDEDIVLQLVEAGAVIDLSDREGTGKLCRFEDDSDGDEAIKKILDDAPGIRQRALEEKERVERLSAMHATAVRKRRLMRARTPHVVIDPAPMAGRAS